MPKAGPKSGFSSGSGTPSPARRRGPGRPAPGAAPRRRSRCCRSGTSSVTTNTDDSTSTHMTSAATTSAAASGGCGRAGWAGSSSGRAAHQRGAGHAQLEAATVRSPSAGTPAGPAGGRSRRRFRVSLRIVADLRRGATARQCVDQVGVLRQVDQAAADHDRRSPPGTSTTTATADAQEAPAQQRTRKKYSAKARTDRTTVRTSCSFQKSKNGPAGRSGKRCADRPRGSSTTQSAWSW